MSGKFDPPLNRESRKSRRKGPAARTPRFGGGRIKAHRAWKAARLDSREIVELTAKVSPNNGGNSASRN